jgi:hypothetical protein
MTLAEAFNMLQALGPDRAVEKWGNDGMKCPAVQAACSITLDGLQLEPSGDVAEDAAKVAHLLWLMAIAFEAGRIYEGGTPE